MNKLLISAAVAMSIINTSGALAQTTTADGPQHIEREYIEWTDIWIPGADKSDKPHVLLIGNSITRGYQPIVEKMLEDKAYVARFSTSKSVGDPALLDELEAIMKHTKFDIVQFNNGLHGMGYSEAEYARSFPDLVNLIRKYAPDAPLIWANFTPLYKGPEMTELKPNSYRGMKRNEIALDYIKDKGIEINDLWSVMEGHPEYYRGGDGSHPLDIGYEALARKVASVIESHLK